MEFPYIRQIQQSWQNLKMYQKAMLASGVVLLAGIISLVIVYKSTIQYTLLLPDDRLKAISIVDATSYLESQHIPYKLLPDNTLFVPTNQLVRVRTDLLSLDVNGVHEKGYELFDSNTWIKGEKELQILELRALKGQLERDLTQFENIKSASVILDIAPPRPFGGTTYKTKASVILNLMPGARISSSELRAITYHVSGAVRGLAPNMIAISDTTGKLYQAIDPDGNADQVRFSEIALEDHIKAKIDGMLATIVGFGNYYTTVQVSLSRERVVEEKQTFANTAGNISTANNTISNPIESMKMTTGPGKVESISITVLVNKLSLDKESHENAFSHPEYVKEEIQKQLKTILEGYNSKVNEAVSFVDFNQNKVVVSANKPTPANKVQPFSLPVWSLYLVTLLFLGAILVIWRLIKASVANKERRSENAIPKNTDRELERMIQSIQSRLKNNPRGVAAAFHNWLRRE